MTHRPPPATRRRFSAHRSRWHVARVRGGSTSASSATSSSHRPRSSAAKGPPRAATSAVSSRQRSAPTGSAYQGSSGAPASSRTPCRTASRRPTASGSAPRSRGARSHHAKTRTVAPGTACRSAPSTVRTAAGVGTPAAAAASANAVARATSASSRGARVSLTANAPRAVSSRQTCPCSPRATGPASERTAPRSYADAMAPAAWCIRPRVGRRDVSDQSGASHPVGGTSPQGRG